MLLVYFGPRERVLGNVFFGGALAEVTSDELPPDLGGLAGNLGRVGFEFFLRFGLLALFPSLFSPPLFFFFFVTDSEEGAGREEKCTSWAGEVILIIIGRRSW